MKSKDLLIGAGILSIISISISFLSLRKAENIKKEICNDISKDIKNEIKKKIEKNRHAEEMKDKEIEMEKIRRGMR